MINETFEVPAALLRSRERSVPTSAAAVANSARAITTPYRHLRRRGGLALGPGSSASLGIASLAA